jgi:threonine dehydrogenase-like Zn-dependent dehydrogenase
MAGKSLAAVATGILQTEVREFGIPDIEVNEGLLKIEAAGICGSDWGNYREII